MGNPVLVTRPCEGVVLISMQDRASKNSFSEALVSGLIDAYAQVARMPDCRAVVLTGYDTYFASGGTQDGLLAIQEGKITFADVNMYSLAMDCPVPVVAAMQGHGIGGGFVMGMYCDIVVLARESVYTTNFMKYGFTPGMGATAIVPKRLGFSLAHEMLLAAATYRGTDLERKGVPFDVLPRSGVLDRALAIATSLAEKPRKALVTLKAHMVKGMRNTLTGVVAEEVAMHEKTFHEAEVRSRIQGMFGR